MLYFPLDLHRDTVECNDPTTGDFEVLHVTRFRERSPTSMTFAAIEKGEAKRSLYHRSRYLYHTVVKQAGVEIPGPRLNDEYGMHSMSCGLPSRHRFYLALLPISISWQ